jgi:long-chain acyl-CoA synthetase
MAKTPTKQAAASKTTATAKAAKPAAKSSAKAAAPKAATTKPAAKAAQAKPQAVESQRWEAGRARCESRAPAANPAKEKVAPYAARPWLVSYSKVVPAEIGPLPYANIGELLVDACRKFSSRPAFTCMDKTLTYAELERHSANFGAFLQSKGLKPGARGDHDAQYIAISDRDDGHLARRLCGGEREPTLRRASLNIS